MPVIPFDKLIKGDVFQHPWEAEVLRVLETPERAPLGERVKISVEDLSNGHRTMREYKPAHLCRCLRPGERDLDLNYINATRG